MWKFFCFFIKYADMQHKYVNMQHKYVDMKECNILCWHARKLHLDENCKNTILKTLNIAHTRLSTCQILLVYVHMQRICVNRQLISVDMQLISVDMHLIYVDMRDRSVDMQLISAKRMCVDILISKVDITKMHVNIKSCKPT